MRPIETMDDDELRPHLAGLWQTWEVAVAESEVALLEHLQSEIPRVEAEIRSRGV